MDDDVVIREKVAAELDFDPSVRASGIAVAASRGIVTLYGHAPSHADKVGAVRAAHRIEGVRAVAVQIVAGPESDLIRSDTVLAEEVVALLMLEACANDIRATVENSWVTLEGCVDVDRKRRQAESRVRKLDGVTGVTNNVHLACDQRTEDLRDRVLASIRRHAELGAAGITVTVVGTKVDLTGEVASDRLAKDAEDVVRAVAGVTALTNRLRVSSEKPANATPRTV